MVAIEDRLSVALFLPQGGAGPLDTSAVHRCLVPADALIARPGTGLAALSWGPGPRAHVDRRSSGVGVSRVIGIHLARMMKRRQFGQTLFEHPGAAHADGRPVGAGRPAALRAGRDRRAGPARPARRPPSRSLRRGWVKRSSLSAYIFGGSGYLVDETPLGQWWRDMKLARVGGGTDEVLWELVAAAMKPDYDGYAS